MPELQRISATRIVATPAALDAARWPDEALALRFAPDEMLVIGTVTLVGARLARALSDMIDDPYAIVVPDAGFAAAWLPASEALELLERTCEWELPSQRPAFAQGAVAGLPVKLWLEEERVLMIVPAPYAHDLKERMA